MNARAGAHPLGQRLLFQRPVASGFLGGGERALDDVLDVVDDLVASDDVAANGEATPLRAEGDAAARLGLRVIGHELPLESGVSGTGEGITAWADGSRRIVAPFFRPR